MLPITDYRLPITDYFSRKEFVVDKEMEKVKAALEDFGKKVVETVKKGKGEADKVTRIAQVKIEIGSLNRQQKDLYQELGEQFYRNLGKANKKAEAEIAETVTHLSEVEKNIGSLNRTLKAIREDKPAPKKRGRPAKSAAGDQAPKRRGRPPKAASASTAAPKKRGRPPKAATTKAQSAAPKRRGRPPKSASKS
jgi:chromosome segregation ATPase